MTSADSDSSSDDASASDNEAAPSDSPDTGAEVDESLQPDEAPISSRKQFGTFGGVFTPTLLTILGVIMYLREGWIIGNAGLLGRSSSSAWGLASRSAPPWPCRPSPPTSESEQAEPTP